MFARRLVVILVASICAVAPIATAAQPASAPDPSRVILLFVVNPQTDEAKKGVASWIQTFKNSVRFLLADSLGRPGASPTIKVIVTTENVEDINTDILQTSFARQPSLQVLSTIARYSSQSTFVDNDIYLGDLKGSLADPFVFISRQIQPGQYKVTREALSVVTLYAYAMAIATMPAPESNRIAICRILDRANMYKDGDLDAEVRGYLANLFKAISAELQVRECGGKK